MKLVAENVSINVGRDKEDEFVDISIYVNKYGNLVLQGIPSVTYDMLDDELTLTKSEGY